MHFDSHVDGFKFEHPQGMPYYHQEKMDLISKVMKANFRRADRCSLHKHSFLILATLLKHRIGQSCERDGNAFLLNESHFQDCDTVDCPYGANKFDKRCNCFYHKKHKLNNIVQVIMFAQAHSTTLGQTLPPRLAKLQFISLKLENQGKMIQIVLELPHRKFRMNSSWKKFPFTAKLCIL